MKRTNSATLDDLLIQQKLTNRLLAAPLKQTMGQKELIRLLSSTGASDQEIADVLDTTAPTVATTRLRIKKESKR